MSNEVETFLNTWENESKATIAMLKALPEGQYDFRPDAGGRSLGELAWHLSEAEAYMTFGVERGKLELGVRRRELSGQEPFPNLRQAMSGCTTALCSLYERSLRPI